jgi:transposase
MGSEGRQVIEIVPAKLRVIEHRAEVVRCSVCGQRTKGTFPQGVRAALQYGPSVMARALYLHDYQLLPYHRTSQAMRDLFGCQMSLGTLSRSVSGCARQLVETELQIKRRLRHSVVLHADETGLRVDKKSHYVHVASNSRLTHYGYDARRGRGAIEEINLLPGYRGTLVHDGWLSYTYYHKCEHARCGSHLLRELTYFSELEEEHKRWAEPLRRLLLEMKEEVDGAREQGRDRLTDKRVALLTTGYERVVRQGLEANPVPDAADLVGRQARNLVLRLERRQEEVLRFITDFAVPFDNNQAERDLRMIKLRQKISGGFRSADGARQFCRIRGYISTMSKQGKGVLPVLEKACRGAPLSPTRRARLLNSYKNGEFDQLGLSEGNLPLVERNGGPGSMLLGDTAWFPNYQDYLGLPKAGAFQAENVIKVGANRYWGFIGTNNITSSQGWKRDLCNAYVDAGGARRTDPIPGFGNLSIRFLDTARGAMSVFDVRNSQSH